MKCSEMQWMFGISAISGDINQLLVTYDTKY